MIARLTALVLAAASIGQAQARTGPVYVMRHLERDQGQDPGLNTVGKAHAKRLAGWFRHDRPKAIFVTGFRRSRETAAPLAARLHITPKTYDPDQPAAMLAAVRAIKGPVLIVGHSNTVPAIVEALGGPAGPDLSETDFGRIWIVSRSGKPLRVARLTDPQPR